MSTAYINAVFFFNLMKHISLLQKTPSIKIMKNLVGCLLSITINEITTTITPLFLYLVSI